MKLMLLACLITNAFCMGICVAYGSTLGYIINMLCAGFVGGLILRGLHRCEELEAHYKKKDNF